MTTLREAAQQALKALEYYRSGEDYQPTPASAAITALRAALAEPEQRTLTDVTEAVTKTVIEVEKLLCGKIGRQWQPSGMSIQTLVDELAALVAAEKDKEIERLREALHRISLASQNSMRIERLREALHRISLASQNSMSSKDECGRIARAALQKQPR